MLPGCLGDREFSTAALRLLRLLCGERARAEPSAFPTAIQTAVCYYWTLALDDVPFLPHSDLGYASTTRATPCALLALLESLNVVVPSPLWPALPYWIDVRDGEPSELVPSIDSARPLWMNLVTGPVLHD
ncbi:hypothetical protein AURDEDRAFT_176979 [Auricularia subglabra TFB-10046 SS5]|uniref:Uncharacterized protein n=1 Tax=Auricularia subglabra (strain TFB-10046 / SS5) TaxID=717982 RepID=J0WNM1_AURST|nr:hypothetical protein AURDEDRAFT_176979 [Auricularia subglabra TFB-10046 SS5]